jgi:hypothetical protein
MRKSPVELRLYAIVCTMAAACILSATHAVAENNQGSGSTGTVQSSTAEFDWAKAKAGARVVLVSPGAKAFDAWTTDDESQTIFRFSASDPHPTVIIELAKTQSLHRVNASFQAKNAQLDIFLLNEVPKNVGDLGFVKPFASSNDSATSGKTTFSFAPSSAHYVALRWTLQDSGKTFEVSNISAFSTEQTQPPTILFAGGQALFSADGTHDSGSESGAPLEPPVIAAVSP